jgi:ubiquinone/menaquinone biosynthesis C-methylase UbiE
MTDYEQDTKHAYQTQARAAGYKHYHTQAWSWARVATAREQRVLTGILGGIAWHAGDLLLDLPCGTGIAGPMLARHAVQVIAADISAEMMAQSRGEYGPGRFRGYLQADITRLPLLAGRIRVVLCLGFLHRVPLAIKRAALREIVALGPELVVVTASVDSPAQRVKHRLLKAMRPGHIPAPAPLRAAALEAEFRSAGLEVVRRRSVVPVLSANTIFVLRRSPAR